MSGVEPESARTELVETTDERVVLSEEQRIDLLEVDSDSSLLVTEDAPPQVIESGPGDTLLAQECEPEVIETPVAQGPQGPRGKTGYAAEVSKADKNRLTRKEDGLYVSDDLKPDPLAYYILAKG